MTCPTKVKAAWASARVSSEIMLSHGLKPMLLGHFSDAPRIKHTAWMLLLVWLVGCGGGSKPNLTSSTPEINQAAVPEEVATLFERGEIAQAVETLTAMIGKSPQDESLYSLRATAHHRLRNDREALVDLDRAIVISGRDAKLYNNRGFIHLGMQQFEPALADFQRASELAPRYANTFNNRGLLYIAQGKYPDAIAQFDRALEIDNQYVDAYNNRGFAEFEEGQVERALDDFNLAIQLSPNYVNAFNNRGLLRARAGDYENAVIDFTLAMTIDPRNPKYYEHRRDVYRHQGALDKAVADEKKFVWLIQYHELTARIAANARPFNELTQRAKHFLEVDDQESAMQDLDRAILLDSRSAEALAVRAGLHLKRKSIAEAQADSLAALDIEPSQAAYSVLGDVFLSHGDYDRAIENFARARRADPSVAEAYYAKSKLLAKQGETEQAQDNLEQALVLDPEIESRLR